MEIVNINRLIELGWCSSNEVESLLNRYTYEEVQILLSIMSGWETVDSLIEITNYPRETIIDICKRYYAELKQAKEDWIGSSHLGWCDSRRRVQNR